MTPPTWLINETLSGKTDFIPVFNSAALLISAESTDAPLSITKGGYLRVFVVIDGELYEHSQRLIKFGKSILSIELKNYQLKFEPVDYRNANYTLNLKIAPYQINEVMSLYSPLPSTLGDQPVLDSLPTSYTATVYNVANAAATYQALAANPARQTFGITNNGTATVFVDLDAPTALTKRYISIPVGGTYTADFSYQGAVFAWSSNAVAQAIEVREFIQ